MRPENITRVSDRRGERGNVLAYTVISAFFLFLAVGLGVDLSHLYLAKTELQNAADAAALAGASALKDAVPERATNADARATRILNANKYNFNNLHCRSRHRVREKSRAQPEQRVQNVRCDEPHRDGPGTLYPRHNSQRSNQYFLCNPNPWLFHGSDSYCYGRAFRARKCQRLSDSALRNGM
jgi:hypothetical protein